MNIREKLKGEKFFPRKYRVLSKDLKVTFYERLSEEHETYYLLSVHTSYHTNGKEYMSMLLFDTHKNQPVALFEMFHNCMYGLTKTIHWIKENIASKRLGVIFTGDQVLELDNQTIDGDIPILSSPQYCDSTGYVNCGTSRVWLSKLICRQKYYTRKSPFIRHVRIAQQSGPLSTDIKLHLPSHIISALTAAMLVREESSEFKVKLNPVLYSEI